jgi:hypothetical protein
LKKLKTKYNKEKLLEELNSKLCTPEHYAEEVNSGSLYNQYQSLQKEIAVLVEKWENLLSNGKQ